MALHRHRQRHGKLKPPWERPHHAVLEKIGKELRQRLELPRELPHRLLTALMQLNGINMEIPFHPPERRRVIVPQSSWEEARGRLAGRPTPENDC